MNREPATSIPKPRKDYERTGRRKLKRVLVGIGQAGIDIVDNLSGRLAMDTVAIDMDKYALHSSDADHSVYVCEGQLEDTSNLRIKHNVQLNAIDDIRPILEPYDVVYLVAALGGRAGGVILPAVAKESLDMGKSVRGKLILPFEVEESKRQIAEVYLEKISDLFSHLEVYDNHEYVRQADQEITLDSLYSLNSIFEEINRDILREIQQDIVYEDQ